jgi:uroporphyrinogen III methyltransferase/synthase
VRSYHLDVDLQPAKYVAEEIVKALQAETTVDNLKILLARAEGAREMLAVELEKLGAIVDEAIAYRTVPETEDVSGGIARFREEGADVVTFTSSSTAENFIALKLPLPKNLKTASIGPITSATMRRLGLDVDVEATVHDIPGLVDAISRELLG